MYSNDVNDPSLNSKEDVQNLGLIPHRIVKRKEKLTFTDSRRGNSHTRSTFAQEEEKLRLQIRKFLKEILKIWSLRPNNDFPESILLETKRDIVKLMYKLRSGKLPLSAFVSLSTAVYYIQTKSFVKGNEAYLKLSIGNVAWPIGVRDVGIHARAADEKIAGDDKKQVTNIKKSETTRRWLIAVKRIVKYCTNLHENGNDASS